MLDALSRRSSFRVLGDLISSPGPVAQEQRDYRRSVLSAHDVMNPDQHQPRTHPFL